MRALLSILALLLPTLAFAEDTADLDYKTRVIGEAHGLKPGSVFAPGLPLTTFGRNRGRIEEEARGKIGGVSVLLTGTVFGQETQKPAAKLLANEAYVDFGSGENRFTIGKKILSGDVGYGFRPIDVLQREVRLRVLPPQLEGVPNLAWERYTASEAWALILANPGHGERGDPKSDGSVALRYYRHLEVADVHAVARSSQRFGLEAGAAASSVPLESLELHGSFLVQQRGERNVPLAGPLPVPALLAPIDAIQTVKLNSPGKALAGFTFTTAGGWSLIGETWWDGAAPTAGDWRRLAGQAAQRSALLGAFGVPPVAVAGSLAASTQMFQDPSWSRRSALAHLAWSDPAGGKWSGYLDVLRTLEDGGWTATAGVAWESDRVRVEGGLRRFGGRADSAYGLLPERGIAFIGATFAY